MTKRATKWLPLMSDQRFYGKFSEPVEAKYMAGILFIAWTLISFVSHLQAPPTCTLKLTFENLSPAGGTLRLALYSKDAEFLNEKMARLFNFPCNQAPILHTEITDLPYGDYAFAVFQDENDNMVLDKNLFGVPVEPYAFSKKLVSKWRLPTFREVRFELKQQEYALRVRLEKWRL